MTIIEERIRTSVPRVATRGADARFTAQAVRGTVAMVLAGGRGTRLQAAHRVARQAFGVLRGQVPHHRLHALQLHQLRHPARGCLHAVQGPQPHPPHPARLEFPRLALRRVRGSAAGPAAHQRRLVPGHGRRGVPEHRHPAAPGAQARDGVRGRSHLQDGLPHDGRRPRAARREGHRRGHSDADGGLHAVRRAARGIATAASPRSRRSPSSRSPCRAART